MTRIWLWLRPVFLGMLLLPLLGMVPASPVPLQALIMRDGGTIVVDLDPEGRLRLDRRFGSPTHGQFFFDPETGAPEALSVADLRKIHPSLRKRTVPIGMEYYRVFLAEMEKKINSRAGSRSPSSKARPGRGSHSVRRSP